MFSNTLLTITKPCFWLGSSPRSFAATGGHTPKAPSRILWAHPFCSSCCCSRRSDSTSVVLRILRSRPTVSAEIPPGHPAHVQNFESTELTCWEQWGMVAFGRRARPPRLSQTSWRRCLLWSPARSAASGWLSILPSPFPGYPIPVPEPIPRISDLHGSPNIGFCFGGEAKLTSLSSGNETLGRFCKQLL